MARQKDGKTARQHLEAAANAGHLAARQQLFGPERPACLEYLYRWAMELHGRSGVGMSGLAPLRYTEVTAWARLTDRRLAPQEVEALIQLDAALLYPGTEDDDGERV